MNKKILAICALLASAMGAGAQGVQNLELFTEGSVQNNSTSDTLMYQIQRIDATHNARKVISNPLTDNWFVFVDGGVNAYWGDYSPGAIHTRLTPQFNIGVGKWFIPCFGFRTNFTGFWSKAYKSIPSIYTSEQLYNYKGRELYIEKTKWWDLNLSLSCNWTRVFRKYEERDPKKNMNQIISNVGIGLTHHLGLPYGSANEFSFRVELQYSRFFSVKKDWSFDIKARLFLYETDFDGFQNNTKTDLCDENVSINVGFTYYIPRRGWSSYVDTHVVVLQDNSTHIRDLNEQINTLRNALDEETARYEVLESQTPDTVYMQTEYREALRKVVNFPYLVNFVIDKVDVVNREKVNLAVVAMVMKAFPEQKYMVAGYADKYTGTVERNIWLAEHRAKNVYRVLTEEFDVPESQLVISDHGGVDNMFYDDPQLSRSVIISEYNEK